MTTCLIYSVFSQSVVILAQDSASHIGTVQIFSLQQGHNFFNIFRIMHICFLSYFYVYLSVWYLIITATPMLLI